MNLSNTFPNFPLLLFFSRSLPLPSPLPLCFFPSSPSPSPSPLPSPAPSASSSIYSFDMFWWYLYKYLLYIMIQHNHTACALFKASLLNILERFTQSWLTCWASWRDSLNEQTNTINELMNQSCQNFRLARRTYCAFCRFSWHTVDVILHLRRQPGLWMVALSRLGIRSGRLQELLLHLQGHYHRHLPGHQTRCYHKMLTPWSNKISVSKTFLFKVLQISCPLTWAMSRSPPFAWQSQTHLIQPQCCAICLVAT